MNYRYYIGNPDPEHCIERGMVACEPPVTLGAILTLSEGRAAQVVAISDNGLEVVLSGNPSENS